MNSAIISFFVNLFSSVMTLFNKSAFCKMQIFVSNLWSKITKNSLLVNVFKTYPKSDKSFSGSIVAKLISFVFAVVKFPIAKIHSSLSQSSVFYFVNSWYKDFFVESIRGYCLGLFSFCLAVVASWMFNGFMGNLASLLVIAAMVISLLGMLYNKSIGHMISGSTFLKFVSGIFNKDINLPSYTVAPSLSYLIIHCVSGLVIGVSTVITHSIVVPIIVSGIILAGLVIRDFRVGVYASVIVMPFAPTMAVVALVLLSGFSFVIKLSADNKYGFVSTPLDGVLLLLAMVMFISSASSFALFNSIKIYMVYFVFLISYFLIVNSVRTKGQLFFIIKMMLVFGSVVALYGIYQHIFGFDGGTTWTDTEMFEDIATRVVSTFGNPNVLGEYLLLLIPVCAGFVLSEQKVFNKLFFFAVMSLLGLCMIFTYSRGNWIGLIIAIALFFMFYDRRIVWLGVIMALFLPLFLPDTIINRFMSVGNTTDSSTSYRVNIWLGSLAMLKDYWLSGVGLGSEAFNKVYPYYSLQGIIAPHTHNLYLQLVAENGIAGLVTFVALVLTYYRMCIASIIKNKNRMIKATTTGLSAGMFGYLVQGMFDNVWYNYRIVFMFYVIIALTVCSVNIFKKEENFID